MGCCCSSGVSRAWIDQMPQPLPEGIILLDPKDKTAEGKRLKDAALDVLAASFAGSETSCPEGNLSWSIDPAASGADPCQPLLAAPDADRKACFAWLMKYTYETMSVHNGNYRYTTFVCLLLESKT